MKRSTQLVRFAAVLCSAALVATYVSCRSQPEAPLEAAPPHGQPRTLPGSKSAAIFPAEPERPQVMGGSKSALVLTPREIERTKQTQQPR